MKEPARLETRQITFSGGCLCGAVRFTGTELRDVVFCHCGQCRRFHGNTAAYAATAKERLSLSADGSLRWYESSPAARRGFCAACGSSLFWEPQDKPYICVAAGAIDTDVPLRAACHVYVGDKRGYYDINDDLPTFNGSMHD